MKTSFGLYSSSSGHMGRGPIPRMWGQAPSVHVRTCRAALLHPLCARAHLPCSIATPAVCTCAPAMQHRYALCVHVRTCRAALLHPLCARAHLPCSVAIPLVCTCAPAVQRCDTLMCTVHLPCGIKTPLGARAHLPCNTATSLASTCARAAAHRCSDCSTESPRPNYSSQLVAGRSPRAGLKPRFPPEMHGVMPLADAARRLCRWLRQAARRSARRHAGPRHS